MPTYFKLFPTTLYKNKNVVDISKRTAFVDKYLSDVTLMLPYTVSENETPEEVAYYYYGSIEYFWIILMVNKMYNYYEDWVMDDNTFNNYLEKKYKEESKEVGYDVVAWTMNQTILDNVLYYYDDEGNTISKDTVIIKYVPKEHWDKRNTITGQKFLIDNFLGGLTAVKPLRIYDYEFQNNETKRNIVLVNKNYFEGIIQEFKKSFK